MMKTLLELPSPLPSQLRLNCCSPRHQCGGLSALFQHSRILSFLSLSLCCLALLMSSGNAWSDVANPTVKQSNASHHDEKSTHSHQHDGNGHSHQHGAINVGKEFAKPELGLVLYKDEVDGYNLFIDVNNFNFQLPLESAKQLAKLGMRKDSRTKFANAAGGHAHLYIGDKKIGHQSD